MDFEEIENFNETQILKLYSDVLESTDTTFLVKICYTGINDDHAYYCK